MEPDYEGDAFTWLDTAGEDHETAMRSLVRANAYASLAVAQATRNLGIELRDIKSELTTLTNQVFRARLHDDNP